MSQVPFISMAVAVKSISSVAPNDNMKQIKCREVDHHKIDYDPTTSDNPFKLAYTDLKSNGKLSSVSDA